MRLPLPTEQSERSTPGLNALTRAVGLPSSGHSDSAEELLAGLGLLCGLGIFKATADGHIIHANSRMEEIWQMSAGDLATRWIERIHPEDVAYAGRIWSKTIGNGQPYSCRYRVLLPDGSVRQIFARAVCISVRTQSCAVVVGTVDDITDQIDIRDLRARETLGLEVNCRHLHPNPAGSGLSELVASNAASPAAVYVDDSGIPRTVLAGGSAHQGLALLWTSELQELAEELAIEPLTLAATLQLPDCRLDKVVHPVMSVCVRFGSDTRSFRERWIPLLDATYGQHMCTEIDGLQSAWARNLEFAIPDLRDASLFDILLCTREAVLNGLIHGCPNGGVARLSILYNHALSRVNVRVSDPGIGHSFDAHIHDRFELLDKHRGLYLIRQFAHQVLTERNGATIQMTFNLNQSELET